MTDYDRGFADCREMGDLRLTELKCPDTITDHGARQAWARGRRDAADTVRALTPTPTPRARTFTAPDDLSPSAQAQLEDHLLNPTPTEKAPACATCGGKGTVRTHESKMAEWCPDCRGGSGRAP